MVRSLADRTFQLRRGQAREALDFGGWFDDYRRAHELYPANEEYDKAAEENNEEDNAREEDYDEAMSDTTAHTEKPLNKDDDSDVEEDSMSLP